VVVWDGGHPHACMGDAVATWIHHGNVRVPTCAQHAASLRQGGTCTVVDEVDENQTTGGASG
jgi:hypothetical protein